MFFKENPLLIALLLCVIVFFAFLSANNQENFNCSKPILEGMANDDDDDEMPLCTGDVAPTCSNMIMDTSYNPYEFNPDYILRTQIVPPVCPQCPSVINQHSHDGEVTSENNRLSGSEQ